MERTYKKLWTLNPTGYKTLTAQEVIRGYAQYLMYCEKAGYDITTCKTIAEWLKTEI